MNRGVIIPGAVLVAFAIVSGAAARAAEKLHYVDLQPQANRKLTSDQGRGIPGSTLASLPAGEQELGDFKFKIGPGLIQLGSQVLENQPEKVEGIEVKKKFSKLQILQAVCFGGGPNTEGSDWHITDGTELGHYLVHYKDKTTARIPIVYGEDVRDWFYQDGEKETSRAKVVWHGDNPIATQVGCHIRLYATTWTNPKPDVKVMRIDYISRKDDTPGAPMCLALTAVKEKRKDQSAPEKKDASPPAEKP